MRYLLGVWFHVLGKNISVVKDGFGDPIIHDRLHLFQDHLSQSDNGWNRAGFFLTWKQALDESVVTETTLICFGAPLSLIQRFENVRLSKDRNKNLQDPYDVIVVVLNDLFLQLDNTLWNLSSVYRLQEAVSKILLRDENFQDDRTL